ncbi:zinc-binding alcohol dehydrogenase [soil metagenome]
MPRELVAIAPRTPKLREYQDVPLGPRQIRIRSELASPKHGTELVAYRDDLVASRPYDPTWGAVMPRTADNPPVRFPMPLGNMTVGVVTEAGADVSRFHPGDRVFGHFPIRETHTVDEMLADRLPDGLSAEAALCLDPVVMALAMRDAGINLGDRVAVFGLGAIGLIAVQIARLAGAETVIAVEPLPNRREVARSFGADILLDPRANEGDTGLAIRQLMGSRPATGYERPERRLIGGYLDRSTQLYHLGVDVAVETSGSIAALQHAIRATRFGGTVSVVSYYGRDASELHLGEEFHVNQITLVSLRSESQPLRDAPAWTLERLVALGLKWMIDGRIRTGGIIDPIVPFEESAEAYRMIDEHPERSIKLGVRFP